MSSPAHSLVYGLFHDFGRSIPWGEAPAQRAQGAGSGYGQRYMVYGRIHAGQQAAIGVCSDSVVVTVHYQGGGAGGRTAPAPTPHRRDTDKIPTWYRHCETPMREPTTARCRIPCINRSSEKNSTLRKERSGISLYSPPIRGLF